ncbi:hypothetical protein EJB05_34630, partial [Eragrostis curvula]
MSSDPARGRRLLGRRRRFGVPVVQTGHEEHAGRAFRGHPWRRLRFHQARKPGSISRVNQFDVARLDVEMSAMLKRAGFQSFLFDEARTHSNTSLNSMLSLSYSSGGSRFGLTS